MRGIVTDGRKQFIAVNPRHADIQNNQIRTAVDDLSTGIQTVIGDLDRVSVFRDEHPLHGIGHRLIIINNQYLLG